MASNLSKFTVLTFSLNAFPMKTTVNLSKLCSSYFMRGLFIKILPNQTFVPYGMKMKLLKLIRIYNLCKNFCFDYNPSYSNSIFCILLHVHTTLQHTVISYVRNFEILHHYYCCKSQ